MNYSSIHANDIANGVGCRVSLFVSGCRNHCKGCFQPETWDFKYGKPFDDAALNMIFEELDKPWVNGLSILGGDPMEPENASVVYAIVCAVKDKYPDKTIWLYTGYLYEDVIKNNPWMLKLVDVIVDGSFVEDKKVLGEFRGSSNQRIIDVKKTDAEGALRLWKPYYV